MSTGNPLDALVAAIPHGLNQGSDRRGVLVTTVLDVDATSGQVLASMGGDPAWLLALTGTYSVGDTIAVLRNPWSGRAEIVLGPVPDAYAQTPPLPVATDTVPRFATSTRRVGTTQVTRRTPIPPTTDTTPTPAPEEER